MLRDRWFRGRKSRSFTLQWHLTNQCPYHCHHCYDRSPRSELTPAQAREVLGEVSRFAHAYKVNPHVCLTGGDPTAYPYFWDIYEAAAGMGLPLSILGNPIPREWITQLLTVQPPVYYQVSLEGLQAHNDKMRGHGHYARTLAFLETARELGLRTHVMLTLTRVNLQEALSVGKVLERLTCRFTFNRLAQVGEAADLEAPGTAEFVDFLKQWLRARRENPVLGVKDNLLNIVRYHFGKPLYGGCTGSGCGAAFNFVALLPDGEVHACRKFPSCIGNIHSSGLREIYASQAASRYRAGLNVCRKCKLRNACGGCQAVVYGQGLNPGTDPDPHCFWDRRDSLLAGF